MNKKYWLILYIIATLVLSLYIHVGAETIWEFLFASIITLAFFLGIYFCLRNIRKDSTSSIKTLKIIGVMVLLALILASAEYASLRQLTTRCEEIVGENIFTHTTKKYCDFSPWYAPQIQQTNTPTNQPQNTQPSPASSENNFKTYTLDVSNITSRESGSPVTGNLIISHNALAVFPLDLEDQNKKLTELSPMTIFEVQTKSGCWNQEDDRIIRDLSSSKPLQARSIGNIRKIILEMPYHASQDNYTRIPAAFCVGFHTADNKWAWNTAPTKPTLDDNLQQGRGEIELDAENVDGIAVLFDTTTVIKTITFEASKIR